MAKKKVTVEITVEPPPEHNEQNERVKQIAKYAARQTDYIVNEDEKNED
jgi:hypothetical protein